MFDKQIQTKSNRQKMIVVGWDLAGDEMIQIFLFLTVSDVCKCCQVDSTTLKLIRSNNSLWSLFMKRDFLKYQLFQSGSRNHRGQQGIIGFNSCDQVKDYVYNHVRYHQFPFDRITHTAELGENMVTAKVFFGVSRSSLNLVVLFALMRKQFLKGNEELESAVHMDNSIMYLASRRPQLIPHLRLLIWMSTGLGPFRGSEFSRSLACVLISLDSDDAWKEDSYVNDDIPHNSLSKALYSLKEVQPTLNLEPPHACKGVLIVGLGTWSPDAPISKQRFLKDCTEVFHSLPMEYMELTADNVEETSDAILSLFFSCYQEATMENEPHTDEVMTLPEKSKQPRCTII